MLPLRQTMDRRKEGATSGSAIPTCLKQPLLYNNNDNNTPLVLWKGWVEATALQAGLRRVSSVFPTRGVLLVVFNQTTQLSS